MNIDSLFEAIQDACLPGVWSKGVSLSREETVMVDRGLAVPAQGDREILLRVLIRNRPVSPRVTLWPDDEDWFCDCGDRNDPCLHVAAAVIALKSGHYKDAGKDGGDQPAVSGSIKYRFFRKDGALSFERFVIRGREELPLPDSLVGTIGGINSGRISAAPIAATKEDFAVDQALGQQRRGILDVPTSRRVLAALASVPGIFLDDSPVSTSRQPTGLSAEILDDGGGFRVRGVMDETINELFSNGIALCGDVLHPIELPALSVEERELLSSEGRHLTEQEAARFVAEILPVLEKKLPIHRKSARLPKLVRTPPRIQLKMQKLDDQSLSVVPTLVYGNPPLAEVVRNQLELHQNKQVPLRDPAAEKQLIRKLQDELHLSPGQLARFEGPAAVSFTRRAQNWETAGDAADAFSLRGRLVPVMDAFDDGFRLRFESPAKSGEAGDAGNQVSAEQVFQAWRDGEQYLQLSGGGFAPLPTDWLEKYGDRISALLAARDAKERLPRHLLPELVDVCEELGESYPEALERLKKELEEFERIPEAPLPKDLTATLRSYQRKGVDWLCFMRDKGMGAMLADDMGLGKTLQALCAIRGRTLVVAPTSVLQSWMDHVQRFRPGLRATLYYGANRRLDRHADITLTSYTLLRMDAALLTAEEWDTVILDEAQTIRNPSSQVTRAAYELQGGFKLTLSGTPVENHLDDIWSQFHFLNPGLLGKRSQFQTEFGALIAGGSTDASRRLRARIRPFMLRRLKKDVAPELPPRIETVLHCELDKRERNLYQSLLAATKSEVLEHFETGGSVFGALEALLRLRQACCHPALVPGQQARDEADPSSKIALLLEMLENSFEQGHRALVFSQWTSFLDLIQPHLERKGFSFSRLDGSTPNRSEVVQEFQAPDGPQMMLLSLKAGGVGLTLTAADHVYLLDPWWNPATEDQAADRAHRIGQENPVLIHRLVAKDTVEDGILALQKKKLAVAGAVLQDAAAAASLTRDDIIELLNS